MMYWSSTSPLIMPFVRPELMSWYLHAHRRPRFLVAAAGLVVGLLSLASDGQAQQTSQPPGVNLSLVYRPGQKTGLLVLPITGAWGDSLSTMLARDLDYSDRFTLVPTSSVAAPAGPANYGLYAKLGVDGLVQGTVLASGWLRIALHDVAKKTVANQKDFPLPATPGSPAWRLAVHGIADGVEEWISGQRGIAQTRIAFERGGRVWIVDSDGANVIAVTPNGMSPSWLPSGRGLVYAVLGSERSPIMAVDLATGAQRVVTTAPNTQNISPAVSPDGRTVAFGRVSENGTDIYTVPLEGGPAQRITVGRGRISAQPSFSPDGQRIVFMSDRSGYADVYISDADGTNAEVLSAATYGDRSNRTGPDWSPDGRLVAIQSLNGNTKTIMTINLRDQSVRAVATEGRNSDPSWAPDSRHLVFTSDRGGVNRLWIVDNETGRTRMLPVGPLSRLAAWSSRLVLP
jgi:TolB protein